MVLVVLEDVKDVAEALAEVAQEVVAVVLDAQDVSKI